MRKRAPLTTEQQHTVASLLPKLACIARKHERSYGSGIDFEASIALRLCQNISEFDPAKGELVNWAKWQAHFACRELLRAEARKKVYCKAKFISIDNTYTQDGSPLSDVLPARNQITELEEPPILRGLDKRSRSVLWRHVVDKDSMTVISKSMGISRSYASQIKCDAVKYLRSPNPKTVTSGDSMKAKTIKQILIRKTNEWIGSIEDEAVRKLATDNTIVTGGCIASMLLGEDVNDYDVYFRTKEATAALANYYVSKFNADHQHHVSVSVENDRVRIVRFVEPDPDNQNHSGVRGETAGVVIDDPGDIEDQYQDTEAQALATNNDEKGKYRPLFMSTNAITLTGKIQLVLRFFGEPDEIHQNYDFVHCTNYWTSWNAALVLHQKALESLLSRELRYVGSKYPICSVFRLRKFLKRNWHINAGQILKMCFQISELDLKDIKVLEDQLTGVDVAFFRDIVEKLKAKDPDKVNCAYLVEIIDRLF